MEGDTNCTNPAIERFRIMSKGLKGQALVAMIKQALSSPSIHVFGEILSLPNVKDLKNHPQYAPVYNALALFAYDTLSNYQHPAIHPELDACAYRKLQLLTIVALANQQKVIKYDKLFEEVKVSNVRELEDLIIDAIYSGLIKAKMDQKARVLQVHSAVSRDIRPEDLPHMEQVLRNWSINCQSVLSSLELQVEKTRMNLVRTYQHKVNLENEIIHTNQAIMQDEQQKIRNDQAVHSDQTMGYGATGSKSRGHGTVPSETTANVDKGGKKTPKAKTAAKSGGGTSAVKTSKLY